MLPEGNSHQLHYKESGCSYVDMLDHACGVFLCGPEGFFSVCALGFFYINAFLLTVQGVLEVGLNPGSLNI